jgi:hypothetical protein
VCSSVSRRADFDLDITEYWTGRRRYRCAGTESPGRAAAKARKACENVFRPLETSGSHPQFGYWGGSSDMAVYTRFQTYVHSLSSVKEKDRYMKTAFQKIGYVIANAVFSSRRSCKQHVTSAIVGTCQRGCATAGGRAVRDACG